MRKSSMRIPGHALVARLGRCECGHDLVHENDPPWRYTRWAIRDAHRFHKLDVLMATELRKIIEEMTSAV